MISNIVDTVYKSTISGNLKWEPSKSIFNSDTRHKYQAMSPDGKTKFTCDIILDTDMSTMKITSYETLDIHNENIVDGVVRCNSNQNANVKLIYEWIYNNHLKKTLMVKNQKAVYNDILKSIDTSEYRDKKITEVLGEKNVEEENKDEEFKNKGFIKRLFGR